MKTKVDRWNKSKIHELIRKDAGAAVHIEIANKICDMFVAIPKGFGGSARPITVI